MRTGLSLLSVLLVLAASACTTATTVVAADADITVVAAQDLAATPKPESPPESPTAPASQVEYESVLAGDTVVLVWTETGGCARIGDNCFRYVVTADGGVTSYRAESDDPERAGTIDLNVVNAWIAVVNITDIDALMATLSAGEFRAASDGVDYTLEAPFANLSLSSVDVQFDVGEWFFRTAESMVLAAKTVAQPELVTR